MVRINIELDDNLHKILRKKALDKKVSMTKVVVRALELYLWKHKDEPL